MNEGFQEYFQRFGDWPWRSPREYRQRDLIEVQVASSQAIANAVIAALQQRI